MRNHFYLVKLIFFLIKKAFISKLYNILPFGEWRGTDRSRSPGPNEPRR